MHHVVLERWSRGSGPLHRRDPRVKLVLLLAFLVALATRHNFAPLAAVLAVAIAASRLPVAGLLGRTATVLPFSAAFALFSLAAGDSARAFALIARTYLSAAAVLAVAGTTPMPQLLRALEWLRFPSFLVLVVQFLYRYLFVVSEQAQHMRQAAACRGGTRFRGAAGAVAVLFARSYERAAGIHQAMVSRGFDGRIRVLAPARAKAADFALLAGGLVIIAAGALR